MGNQTIVRLNFLRKAGVSLCVALLGFVDTGFVHAQVVTPLTVQKGLDEKLLDINLVDAPLDQALDIYTSITGLTLLQRPGLNSKTITLKTRQKLTESEALQALEAVFAMNDIALVPSGDKFLKVVEPTTIRTEGMKFKKDLSADDLPESDELMSQIVEMKHVGLDEVQPILDSFKHPYGSIQKFERTGSFLITDTSSNIKRILEILEYIDRPADMKMEIRIYEIRHAEASHIAGQINELIAESQQENAANQRVVGRQNNTTATPRRGVIRPGRNNRNNRNQPTTPAANTTSAAEMAEQGVISGTVKIVADEPTNLLIIISHPENFVFFDKIIEVLDRRIEPEVEVEVCPLEYAVAEEVAGILNEFIGAATSERSSTTGGAAANTGDRRSTALRDFISRRAQERTRNQQQNQNVEAAGIGQLSEDTRILSDERTNSLLLMGRKQDIAVLKGVIKQLDVMLPQVLIEAIIIEVALDEGLQHGMDWLQRSTTFYNVDKQGPNGGVSVREPVLALGGGQNLVSGDFQDGSLIDRAAPLGGSALTYYSTLFDLNLDTIIRLAASENNARILSTPVVMTTDNTEASILVGERRPVVTTTSTTDAGTIRSAFEYTDIGIELKVTPRINPQRFVVLEVEQTADSVQGSVTIDNNEVPIITTRAINATIAVENRGTIALGGLISTDNQETISKIPFLGDIPLLGNLFRSVSHDDRRRELLVLLTPYVIMNPSEAAAETSRLEDSTDLDKMNWPIGWSESSAARKSIDQQQWDEAEAWVDERREKKRSWLSRLVNRTWEDGDERYYWDDDEYDEHASAPAKADRLIYRGDYTGEDAIFDDIDMNDGGYDQVEEDVMYIRDPKTGREKAVYIGVGEAEPLSTPAVMHEDEYGEVMYEEDRYREDDTFAPVPLQ